ncbi:MAG: Dabb family protein [Verrucomicrobiota bacterium]
MKLVHLALVSALTAAATLFTPTAVADDHKSAAPFRHFVSFQFKESATDNDIQKIVDEFVLLGEKIEEIVSIEWGTAENIEPLNDDFTHSFLVTFEDKAGLEVYLPHPDHVAFVEILKPHLEKVFVFDYTAKD